MNAQAVPQARLEEQLALCRRDPARYIRLAFPWGEGELAGYEGLDVWQQDVVDHIGREMQARRFPILVAVASGHGVGKSGLVGMIAKWAQGTMPRARGVVTANTDNQLRTKTWPELGKWHRLGIDSHLFRHEATSYKSADPEETGWRIDAIPWSEKNTEAFAGLHNKGRRVLVIFDEASAIPDKIWEVTEGALTDEDTEIIWIAFGNPTRNTGRFRECFGRHRHRWFTKHVDSRTSRFTNKRLLQEWVDTYGIDSDFVKVRVLGEFPSQSIEQLIGTDVVDAARERAPWSLPSDPFVIGVDCGRGVAETVIAVRQGKDARSARWLCFRERDSMIAASRVCAVADDIRRMGGFVGGIFIDNGDTGGPVADRCRQLGYDCAKVNFGGKATLEDRYADKAAEMWCRMRDWLEDGGAIPDDPILGDQLTARERTHDNRQRVKLESKDHLVERGLESPDRGDGLALTFAFPVFAPEDRATLPWGMQAPQRGMTLHDPHPHEGM